MIFRLFIKEISKTPFFFLINSFFLSLIFSVSVVALCVSMTLPSKYKNMVDAGARIFIMQDVEFEKYNFDDYYLVWDDAFSSVCLNSDTENIGTFLIISDRMQLDDNKMYISRLLFEKLESNSNFSLTIMDNQYFSEKTFSYEYEVIDSKYEAVYFSKSFYNELCNAPMMLSIVINDFDDIEKANVFFNDMNIDIEDYDNGYYGLYKSIKIIEKTLIIISIVLIFYMALMSYNMMDSYLNKRDSFIGTIKCFGCTTTDVFLLYLLITVFLSFISCILSLLISFVVIGLINNCSIEIFDMNLSFNMNWFLPFLLFCLFILIFLLFFGQSIKRKLKRNQLIDFLKGGV